MNGLLSRLPVAFNLHKPRQHQHHLERYAHLMPGSEEEAASLLDSYLQAQR
jgi:hypothetical protein